MADQDPDTGKQKPEHEEYPEQNIKPQVGQPPVWRPPVGQQYVGQQPSAPKTANPLQNYPVSQGYLTPQHPAPRAGSYPGYPAGYLGPQPTGWTPPPRPTLIPLRPLNFGTLLWAPFKAIRRNPGPVLGTGFIIQFVITLLVIAAVVPFFSTAIPLIGEEIFPEGNPPTPNNDALLAGAIGSFFLLMLASFAVSLVGGALLQGVLITEIAGGILGEKRGLAELWRRAAKRLGPLIGWSAIQVLLIVVVVIVIFIPAIFLIGVLVSTIGQDSVWAAVAIILVIGLGVAVLIGWVMVKLSVVPSAIVLEKMSPWKAMARSWTLTQGYFWRTFGVLALTNLMLSFAGQFITVPFGVLGGVLRAVIDPTSSGLGSQIDVVVIFASGVVSLVISAISSVVIAGLIAIIYIDLRMRKERLDLTLQRAVEETKGLDDQLYSTSNTTTGAPPANPPGSWPER